jgi:hypothetical protein
MTTPKGGAEVEVPKGMKPGDVPDGLAWPRSLWLILPETPTKVQVTTAGCLRAKAQELDVTLSEVRLRNIPGPNGQQFPLVPEKDVAGIYRRAHRARTAIVATSGAKILLELGERPSNKGCVSLQEFVRYKCFYGLVSRAEEVDRTLAAAIDWMGATSCENSLDPRCYPKAIFQPRGQAELETARQRSEFIALHRLSRQSNALTDAQGRTWTVGPYHTLDLIQVAGRTLPIGLHWDVQTPRDTEFSTGWEKWSVRGRGYVNIHPDAYIRGKDATKTYPTVRTKEPTAARKTTNRGKKRRSP